jgi:hypothetical protein
VADLFDKAKDYRKLFDLRVYHYSPEGNRVVADTVLADISLQLENESVKAQN